MNLNHEPLAFAALGIALIGLFACSWVLHRTWKDYQLSIRHKMSGVPRVYNLGHLVQAIVREVAALLLTLLAFLLALQPLQTDQLVVMLRIWAVISLAILLTVAGLHWRFMHTKAGDVLREQEDE